VKTGIHALCCLTLLLILRAAQAQDRTFDSNGVKIRYIVEGRGEPVVLIHGFTASIETNWRLPGIIRMLAADHQVIALDCRGHGKSGKPHEAKQYGPEMAEDVVRLMDHLHIAKAHIVGYSMGANLTVELLVRHPDRILTATLGGAGGIRKNPIAMRYYDRLADSLEQGRGLGPLLFVLNPPGRPLPSQTQVQAVSQAVLRMNDAKALAAVARGWKEAALDHEDIEKLRACTIPTLAIVGSLDPAKRTIEALKRDMPGLQVVEVADATHMTTVGRPEFKRAILEFLAAHKGGGAQR